MNHSSPVIAPAPPPSDSLLLAYGSAGAYTDCFGTQLGHRVSQQEFVEAFYTSPVFKLERLILKWLVSKPSSDAQARQLAQGAVDRFAAWTVERRAANQLLLCDFMGRTRSWLMTEPLPGGGTRLYFGSAVVPEPGAREIGFSYRALLGFHKLYSRVLLHAAVRRLIARA